MMMLIIIANDITSSKSQIRFSLSIPYFTNITIPSIEKIKMMLRIQSMAVQNKTIQSFSPNVLLYGSRKKSLRHGNWKEASEMFVTKVHNILLLAFNVWLGFDVILPNTATSLLILWQLSWCDKKISLVSMDMRWYIWHSAADLGNLLQIHTFSTICTYISTEYKE